MTEPPTVLVVEDDDDLRECLCDLLDGRARRARGVPDGEQAVHHLLCEPAPAAILLDLRLPVLNGWDFLEWLRGESDFRAIPVVLLTGAPLEYLEVALPHGPTAWLRKPVDPRTLVRAIDEACGRAA